MAPDKTRQPEEWLRPSSESSKHYSVPDGYFDNLTNSIMECIDSQPIPDATHQPIHWWIRVKPLVYLAACFVGLMLTFSVAYHLSSQPSAPEIVSQAIDESNDDEWAVFYSEYADRSKDYERDLDYTL